MHSFRLTWRAFEKTMSTPPAPEGAPSRPYPASRDVPEAPPAGSALQAVRTSQAAGSKLVETSEPRFVPAKAPTILDSATPTGLTYPIASYAEGAPVEDLTISKAAGPVAPSDTSEPTETRTADAKVEAKNEAIVNSDASQKEKQTLDASKATPSNAVEGEAAAAFDLYADHGMLKWDAFGTVVRGSGFDPTDSQLAEMWAKTKEMVSDEGRSEYIAFPEFCATLQIAPGPADMSSALAAVVGQRCLTAEEAKTLLTTVGDEPLSETEWSAFEELFFPDGAARFARDLEIASREEDPATSSRPINVQRRERLRARGEKAPESDLRTSHRSKLNIFAKLTSC